VTAIARELLIVCASELELERLLPALAFEGVRAAEGAWGSYRFARLGPLAIRLQALGIGKARTAAGLALAITEQRPHAIIQVGIGGAYLGSFLSIGLGMWADEEMELDLGVASGEGWAEDALSLPLVASGAGAARSLHTDASWTERLANLSGLPRGRFATLDAVTHDIDLGARIQERFGVSIESMEGAAALVVAARLGVPLAELRVVSNVVGERNKLHWDIRGALRVAGDALGRTLRALAQAPELLPSAVAVADGPKDQGGRL
jgi:futalosine hydrolase